MLREWHICVALVGSLILACTGERRPPAAAAEETTATVAAAQSSDLRQRADSQLIAHLRALAPELNADAIHLFSPIHDSVGPTTGRALSPEDYSFFRPFYPNMSSSGELFALGYTTLGPGQTAYILRVPSKYDASSITLWIHQDTRGYWLPPVPVADAYGDANWSFQQDAWLVDRDGDGKRDLVQRRTDWEDGRVVADTVSWNYWQSNFDQFGFQQNLKDAGSISRFILQKREH